MHNNNTLLTGNNETVNDFCEAFSVTPPLSLGAPSVFKPNLLKNK